LLRANYKSSHNVVSFSGEVDVYIKEGTRSKRSIDETFYPHNYDLEFVLAESKVHLHLMRNDNIDANVPTLSLRDRLMTTDVHDSEVSAIKYII
jgi:hypothetical protein